jgi:tetratricopeptide (TPR) repeat protein
MKQWKTLAPDVLQKFQALAAKGQEAWLKRADLAAAEKYFLEAWETLPEPKLEQEWSQIMIAGMLEFYREARQFEKARQWLELAAKSYGDPGNEHVRMLRGQLAYDEGAMQEAAEVLTSLYQEFGGRPFEDLDEKYLRLARARVSRPSSTERLEPSEDLADELHQRIVELSERGDSLAERGKYAEAIRTYRQAWALLPEPRLKWSAATWLLAAIGDAYFLDGDFEEASGAFRQSMLCPDALGNPFLHLRLGQSLLELGEREKGLDHLASAYMTGGRKIFEREDQKYLAELGKVMLPPAGEDSL